jgi:two-component system, NtrC family, response regulator AlgB
MAEASYPFPSLRVLVLDDESTIRTTLALCLEAAGHKVATVGSGREALGVCEKQVFDLLFLDLRLGTENGLDFMPDFFRLSPWIKIIVITAYASIDTAVEAMRRGALDYLPKPFTPEHVEMLAAKVAQTRAVEFRLRELRETMDTSMPPVLPTSDNRQVQSALELARTFAASKSAVLLQGEDGAGKRTLARAVHGWSSRRQAPYMVCTAHGRDEESLGVELFGTGSDGQLRRSRLEHCAGGTLYLDDLCALSPRLQLKVLEFMQGGVFEREETFERIEADVRLIAGASKPLAALAEAGIFRRDLYYAFSAKLIELPALRERMEDFQKLVDTFLAFYAQQNGRTLKGLSRDAVDYLQSYSWPGNLRELRNVIERTVLLARPAGVEGAIGIEYLPPNLRAKDSAAKLGDLVPLEAIEELHIRGVLATTQSLESAARILGIDYATLWRRRKKYGL